MSEAIRNNKIFDRKLLKIHKNRGAKFADAKKYDFLRHEAAIRLNEKIDELADDFENVLVIGAGDAASLFEQNEKIVNLFELNLTPKKNQNLNKYEIIADEELLPFADEKFDLVISVLNLHWVNDLVGCMIQINKSLKPGGIFLGANFGASTLHELRAVATEIALSQTGAAYPSVPPFMDIRDCGSLLARAGFKEPVMESELIEVLYDDIYSLTHDLRGMGETNIMFEAQKHFTHKSKFAAMNELYKKQYANEIKNKITASFEFVLSTCWK